MVQCIQGIPKRIKIEYDLLYASVAERNTYVLLVSEPNKASVSAGAHWYVDKRLDAAIKILSSQHAVSPSDSDEGFV